MPPIDRRIGFMGSGQMAEALAKGLINKGVVTPNQICCTDPVAARRELFQSFGASAYDTTLEVGTQDPGSSVFCWAGAATGAAAPRCAHSRARRAQSSGVGACTRDARPPRAFPAALRAHGISNERAVRRLQQASPLPAHGS